MSKDIIAYKVIGNERSGAEHYGSNAVGCMKDLFREDAHKYDFERLLWTFASSEVRKYFIKYYVHKRVTAPEGSAGILVFRSPSYAESFITLYGFQSIADIYEVSCIGEPIEYLKIRVGCFCVSELATINPCYYSNDNRIICNTAGYKSIIVNKKLT